MYVAFPANEGPKLIFVVGLSVIGLFWSIIDHWEFKVKHSQVYDIEKEPTIIEKKNLDRTESAATGRSHHTHA
jgi:hypothetical protein